jgi:hypothetical protein
MMMISLVGSLSYQDPSASRTCSRVNVIIIALPSSLNQESVDLSDILPPDLAGIY